MHDEVTDPRTQAFFDDVRQSFCVTTPPPPCPALASLFVAGLVNDKGDLPVTAASKAIRSAPQTSGLPNWTRRRIDMMKQLLGHLSAKAGAAALVAALVLGGLGASGALTAPVSMVSHLADDEPAACVPAEDDESTAGGDDAATADPSCDTEDPTASDGTDATTTTDDDEGADQNDDDSAQVNVGDETSAGTSEPGVLPAAPTSVSEAAQIHAFDEACGNHGMYVSFYAQMGFEPPCALSVREGTYDPAASTRQERKTAALEYRKFCKAQMKAGTPCDPAGPAESGSEEQVAPQGETADGQDLDEDREKKAKNKADKAKSKKAGRGGHKK